MPKMASRPKSRASSRTSLHSIKSVTASECVRVVVRCRPMSDKEIAAGHEQIVQVDPARGSVELMAARRKSLAVQSDLKQVQNAENIPPPDDDLEFDPRLERKAFTFDAAYDGKSKQLDLYDEIARPLVSSVLEGFNGTIFAYGQTGTGKTYTMEGDRSHPESAGIIPNSFQQIFSEIARSKNIQYLVRSSYLEIYQEEIRDLLARDQAKRLELREKPDSGVYVKDLSSFVCKSIREIEHVMSVGNQNRSVGATNMNEHSSRSHAIFIITVEQAETVADEQLGGTTSRIRVGKLNLVDLAGSERQAKTGTSGTRQREAIKINLSLSALGNVIHSLVDGKSSHVPYRDSKLTRLLQDSLGGNSKTVMIANIGPASYNYDETLTTLRYASRAKQIKNKPKINEDPKDTLLREFQAEIDRLKNQLERKKTGGGGSRPKTTDSATSSTSAESNESLLGLHNQGSRAASTHPAMEQVDRLESKIRAMESKLLQGGKNIIDHTNEQEREIEERRRALADQKAKEREIRQALEAQEEAAVDMKENFSSLQQEVEQKRKRLRKLYTKLQSVRQEMSDLEEVHSQEREELEAMQTDQLKELKLKYLIIDNFIPPDDKNALLGRIVLDDQDDEQWRIQPLAESNLQSSMLTGRPLSYPKAMQPMCESARQAAMTAFTQADLLRYRFENVYEPQLDMPERTTKDYPYASRDSGLDGGAAEVRAALESVLQEEMEDMDVLETTGLEAVSRRPKTGSRARSARRPRTGAGNRNSGSSSSGFQTPSIYGMDRPYTPFHPNTSSTQNHPQ